MLADPVTADRVAAATPVERDRFADLLRVTSIGVVVSGYGPEDAADLLTRADEALYRAKRSGRNTFAVSMY